MTGFGPEQLLELLANREFVGHDRLITLTVLLDYCIYPDAGAHLYMRISLSDISQFLIADPSSLALCIHRPVTYIQIG